jgi:hypothetical protein
MLTIENINKLEGQPIWNGWEVREVFDVKLNDTYIFKLVQFYNGWPTRECTIMLERTGHKISNKSNLVYFFIYKSQRTDICATADWLADKDNMIAKLEYILVNKENL